MKKAALSLAFVIAFASWTLYLHNKSTLNADVLSLETTTQQSTTLPGSSTPMLKEPTPKKTPVSTPSTTTPPPKKPTQKGMYTDGTYTGSVADAYYGNVQVAAVISNGKLADVKFLQYPNDRGTSIHIASVSLPILRQEAIQSQSANVSAVSGATDDSGAFRESLSSALAQARA